MEENGKKGYGIHSLKMRILLIINVSVLLATPGDCNPDGAE